ncbi:MAG TPA: hypothetical protein DG761_01320 [Gammaproteobacteria bacterium]|jgi:nicotinamide riboside transporter PnuC|nr:hypothetical protein [Gammaproteobacteria bacterium]|tara:strand:- start:8 stop:238 length:231 start_codon:yes stop_codon:yes gene_type:complete
MTQLFGWIAMVLAVSGVWMNNHRMRLCFVLWFFSNGISAVLHMAEGMWPLVVRDVIFNCLAVHGFLLWGRKKGTGK